MITFGEYCRFKEAEQIDDMGSSDVVSGGEEAIEILNSLMKDAWTDDKDKLLEIISQLEAINPGKYGSRIEELRKKKGNIYGDGLDKPDDNPRSPHEIIKPDADRVGDPAESPGQ